MPELDPLFEVDDIEEAKRMHRKASAAESRLCFRVLPLMQQKNIDKVGEICDAYQGAACEGKASRFFALYGIKNQVRFSISGSWYDHDGAIAMASFWCPKLSVFDELYIASACAPDAEDPASWKGCQPPERLHAPPPNTGRARLWSKGLAGFWGSNPAC